jgi:hypothetical protein
MKHSFIYINILIISLCQCQPAKKEGIIDTWILKAEQTDFDINANTLIPVVSKRTLTFSAEGTIISNGNMCALTSDIEKASSGTYDTETSSINISPCGPGLGATRYELKGDELYVYFVCNGTCFQQYSRQSAQ